MFFTTQTKHEVERLQAARRPCSPVPGAWYPGSGCPSHDWLTPAESLAPTCGTAHDSLHLEGCS
jgi:hypothetical protein